ncbi:16S rRNA (uracil(1498)-N(3))-methyltransferase [Planctomycetota bacterium]|nr:16S rRNA (uracil(1498)-N(3))-methyltransferase [Planctomycetota bacterium]
MDAEQRKNQVKARLYCPEFGLGLEGESAQGGSSDQNVGGGVGGIETQATELSDSIPCVLPLDQAKHAKTVLRIGVGDLVEVFNGEGVVGRGKVEVCSKKELKVGVNRWWRERRGEMRLVVATALPKGSRVDGMIDMLTQVGVDEVWSVLSVRSVVDPRKAKLEKLQARAVEGCKQSGRAWLMKVDEKVRGLDEVFEAVGDDDVKLMMHFGGVGIEDMRGMMQEKRRVVLLIGPEGGWADDEVAAAEEKGWVKWTCGGHVLRIETAAVVGAGVIKALEG